MSSEKSVAMMTEREEGGRSERAFILDFLRENKERKRERGLFPTHTTLREIGEET